MKHPKPITAALCWSIVFLLCAPSVSFCARRHFHPRMLPALNVRSLVKEFDDIEDLFIPESYGTVVKQWSPPSGATRPYVVYIQNPYLNPEAQDNISKVVELLVKWNGINFVVTDETKALLDTSVYESQANKAIVQRFYDQWIDRGFLSATESGMLIDLPQYPFTLHQIEGFSFLEQDLASFTQTLRGIEETAQFSTQLHRIISQLKKIQYPAPLYAFDQGYEAYKKNNIGLFEYLHVLEETVRQYPTLAEELKKSSSLQNALNSIKLEEKLLFDKIPEETNAAVSFLENTLPLSDKKHLTEQTLLHRLGLVPASEYYVFLGKEIVPFLKNPKDDVTLSKKQITNLLAYITLIGMQQDIRSETVIEEVHRLSIQTLNLIQSQSTPTQALETVTILNDLAEKCDFLEKHLNLQLTTNDIKEFRNQAEQFSTSHLLSAVQRQAQACGLNMPKEFTDDAFLKNVDQFIKSIDDFYRIILKNNDKFALAALQAIKENKKDRAIIITNPLYSEALMNELEQEEISYVVILPRITSLKETPTYIHLLKSE